MDLFEAKSQKAASASEPLASRLRPASFADFAGQEHIVGEGTLLRRLIESDRLTSLIFYGPPGTGKTTLAGIISRETEALFESVNAVTSNVADLRKVLEKAESTARLNGKKSVLFIDELHRFSKSQQDVLMPYVEKGNPILIGATTHNPYFYIVPPLLSRSVVFELKPLTKEDVSKLLERALADKEKGLGKFAVEADPKALAFLAEISDGDARRALNALEIGVLSTKPDAKGKIRFTLEAAQESIQKKAVLYDRDEDAHYDTISAFIKSMRGSDPDAALYYLAKMLYAGEDPRFIARRIVICAAEDVGNAEPMALVLATAALDAAEFVGMPEARIPLAQAVVFIACSPKSNASYLGIEAALKDVKEGRILEVPTHLKDASYKSAERLGRGEGYKYAHDYEGHFVDQQYLAETRRYYEPTEQGREKGFKEYLELLRKASRGARHAPKIS
jgi:putative ATPase